MRAPFLHVESLDLDAEALLALASRDPQRYPVLLDSAAEGSLSQVSLLAALPRGRLWLDAAGLLHSEGAVSPTRETGFLNALDALWRSESQPAVDAELNLPFRGGWFVYLGYELARAPTSRHYWQDPRDRQGRLVQQPRQWHARFDPADIHQSEFNACDSGGFYWVWKEVGGNAANGDRNRNINRICDLGTDSAAVGRASVLVNGGGFGFAERQAYAAFVSRFRGDSVEPVSNGVLAGNYRGRAFSTYVDYSPQRP